MFTPPYPIVTPRLVLRPFTEADLDDLHAFHSLPEVTRYLYWDARTREETKAALDRKIACAGLGADGDALSVAAALSGGGPVIGDLTLFLRSREHRQGEIGFVFNPACQGRGLATEAAREILRIGFEGLGLHRIHGNCDARNTSSARLMERLGMRLEARLVENEFFAGAWSDELIYGMLAREWRASPAASPVPGA
ncbi:GNAT family N-acetyltransferase [Microbispora triticiradicis]|uniref:GNAT family N-acetyltransferase n=2 Tax=Microbispora TaxID=2005 RepID=A0ABY3LZI6_9ACTN|nr:MULTISPECIES: GNAT family protein [Microbispora]TLP53203.1 GNAT family N-acetyltransferase [Microbispora fusca]TYB59335.1 GNAT family N-acetyltransferase [Microbispora tritici]